jgi:RNA polymerase sigma factor (sigma-70 family)
MTDSELLDQFHRGSQKAFAELVQRHINWVYACALRRVADVHLADDVTQAVFIALAQGKRIPQGAAMSAWMFKVVQYASANLLRSERRRDHHEQEAARQAARNKPDAQEDREAMNGVLDQVVERLGQRDLQAVVLRFYQHKTIAEVGTALGISEEGAKKRLSRAIVKLRSSLMKNGITIPADALGAAIQTSTATSAAPVPLTHNIIQSSLNAGHGVKAAALAKSAMSSLTYAGIKWFAVATAVILIGTTAGGTWLAVSRGQSSPNVSVAPAPTTGPTTVAADVLVSGDRLKVTIVDLVGPGMSSVWTPLVEPNGSIAMPLVPPIPVADSSISSTVDKIRQAYRDANLISHAEVKVERIEQANAPLTGRGPLKAGDKVICHIIDLQGPGIESKLPEIISQDGNINLPKLGNVSIKDESESQAASLIRDAYRNANLISNAQVEVVREQAKSVVPTPPPAPGGER